jgi:hypothetical protein
MNKQSNETTLGKTNADVAIETNEATAEVGTETRLGSRRTNQPRWLKRLLLVFAILLLVWFAFTATSMAYQIFKIADKEMNRPRIILHPQR